jgi:hypothetical protein
MILQTTYPSWSLVASLMPIYGIGLKIVISHGTKKLSDGIDVLCQKCTSSRAKAEALFAIVAAVDINDEIELLVW